MRRAFIFLLTLATAALCVLASPAAAFGQPKPQPSPQQQQQPATRTGQQSEQDPGREVVFIRRVRLPITVLDKKQQFVSGLTASDFLVMEDKKPQTIETFSDESETFPVYIGVLMDTSYSTAGKLKFEQESAKNFIYTVTRLRKDKAAFMTFDDEITLRQDFTDKLDELDRAVDSVKKPGQHTSLYDAIWQFCDEKMRTAPGRRVIVVITDGDDTYSRATLNDAIDIAQRTETTIFAISTKAGFSGSVPGVEAGQVSDRGDRELERLTAETGGTAFFTGDVLALERSFNKISKELRSQYIVTYKPSNDRYDGSFRRVEVKLASGRDGMKVRTRRGYRASSDSVMASQ
ncbi:MAG TPA: VWA domain-containing protein [Pyrinomonadaceae bacterium]|jgi:VWFA-related protein|nr:VWA domain-containing protein [Pyrinomonadaceae bacterium]